MQVFDACINIFGVFAENNHIDILWSADWRGHPLEVANRADAGVQVQLLAQRHIEGADTTTNGRRQRAFDSNEVFFDVAQGSGRQPLAGLIEGLLAGEHLVPVDFALAFIGFFNGSVEDADGGGPDVGANTIPFDIGDNRIVGNN